MTRPPRVAAIVVNYATPDLTAECVRHLRAQHQAVLDVIVVDNTSTPEQSARLRSVLPNEPIVDTGRNLGFAGGVNAGIANAWADAPDFFWVVTPDVAAEPGCLAAMLAAMNSDDRLGICGPAIDAAGEWIIGCRLVERLGFLVRILNTTADRLGQLPNVLETDFVEGCSMLIRAETARVVGPFRLDFFLYYEECDYCLRARDLGWRLAVVPAARIHTRARKVDRNSRPYYMTRNSILLARLRKQHVAAAAIRGVAETLMRGALRPRTVSVGVRAIRDGLSLPIG